MKTYKKLRQQQLDERFVRRGGALVFANQSRTHGNKAEQHFVEAKRFLANPNNKTMEQRVDAMSNALTSLANGLQAMRHQTGSHVSLSLTGVLLNEKPSKPTKRR